MESAIPDHLVRPRSRPAGTDDGAAPPYPSHSARFSPATTRVVMAHLGVQYPDDGPAPEVAGKALAELEAALTGPDGPGSHDHVEYVDANGYRTRVVVAYWADPPTFDRWRAARDWTAPERAGRGAGFWTEIVRPSVERFQTLIAPDRLDGVARIADGVSGEIREHAYWGACRDRIPLSQDGDLRPQGPPAIVEDGPLRTVRPAHNACLVRFDVDWTGSTDREREVFEADVQPALHAGMTFLRDDGRTIGCVANHLGQVLGESGEPLEHSVSLSWWRGIDDVVAWAGSHATHQAIYAAAMRFLAEIGPTARLRLHQETTVAAADEQSFTYLDCHDDTGMLRTAGSSPSW